MLTKNLAQSARLITQSKQWVVPTIATRCYAAPANAAASRPPVALFGIDGTYASALVCYRLLLATSLVLT